MSGYVGNLSPSQEETLQRFRRAVEDFPNKPDDSDHYYLRWLRAKSFHLNNSIEMLQKHLKWRQEVGADQIFDWTPPEVLQKYFPGGFFGEDRDGHPVYYDFYGNIDIRGLYRSCRPDDVIKLSILHVELTVKLLREFSETKGHSVSNVNVVLNLENLSYQQYHRSGIQMAREVFRTLSENYPDVLKTVYIIKAPRIFPIVYKIMKCCFDDDTRRKIVMMSDNWQEELQKYISPDQLPQAYGGTRCEPDPQCTAYINWGGDVPERYYLTNLTETKKEDMERVIVRCRSLHQLEVNVEKEGSLIKWEYLSVDYDIGFGIYYKPDTTDDKRVHTSDMHPVVPTKRTDSHIFPENGQYCCSTTGTYVVQFDNTYSWTRSKEVRYSIEVLPPEQKPDQSDFSNERCTPHPQSNDEESQEPTKIYAHSFNHNN